MSNELPPVPKKPRSPLGFVIASSLFLLGTEQILQNFYPDVLKTIVLYGEIIAGGGIGLFLVAKVGIPVAKALREVSEKNAIYYAEHPNEDPKLIRKKKREEKIARRKALNEKKEEERKAKLLLNIALEDPPITAHPDPRRDHQGEDRFRNKATGAYEPLPTFLSHKQRTKKQK